MTQLKENYTKLCWKYEMVLERFHLIRCNFCLNPGTNVVCPIIYTVIASLPGYWYCQATTKYRLLPSVSRCTVHIEINIKTNSPSHGASFPEVKDAKGHFYLHVLNLIPTWINNFICYEVWDEITHPLQRWQYWSLGMENNSFNTLLRIGSLIHAEIIVNPF